MLRPNRKPVPLATLGTLLLVLVAWPAAAEAGVNDVPRKIRQGIEHYEAGRFDEAAQSFDEARKKQPSDARVLYDAACAKAATGKADEAIPLFQQAAVTPEVELAARCHYNLGRLAADRAKTALGDKPETAQPDARAQARELIATALGHWRDCLAVEPEHADAQYNIELARLWLNHMNQVWKDIDRQKRIEKMKLGEMLKWLEAGQGQLRGATRALDGQEPSPLHRLAVHETGNAQRELGEEIDPLKQKITQEINQPQQPQAGGIGAPGGTAAPGTCNLPGGTCSASDAGGLTDMDPEQRRRAIELLSGLADRAGESMRTAAEHLAEQSPADARGPQSEAIENLDQITTVVTPYADLVHKAVGRQEQLVGEVTPLVKRPGPEKDPASSDEKPAEPDLGETAWRERFVERWIPIMVAKAKQGLEKMPPPEPETPPEPEATGKKNEQARPEGSEGDSPILAAQKLGQSQDDPAEAARKQMEGLRKSMEKAVELGPKVERLVADAAADLDDHRAAEALPKQEEALRLLREIAEPLKQPNQNQQDQNQQNQSKQDQNKDKQDNKDQNKQNQNKDKKDQDKQDKDKNQAQKDKKDQGKNEKEKKDKQEQKAGKQPQPKDQKPKEGEAQRQPRDLTKQQAEALMQQVRQRGREKEKARKALLEVISRPPKTEKDW